MEVHFRREVLPTSPDAWIDQERTKAGCETPFNRHLYVYRPPRDLAEIGVVTDRTVEMIAGLRH